MERRGERSKEEEEDNDVRTPNIIFGGMERKRWELYWEEENEGGEGKKMEETREEEENDDDDDDDLSLKRFRVKIAELRAIQGWR